MVGEDSEANQDQGLTHKDLLEYRRIHPASPQEIETQIDKNYNFAVNASNYEYCRGRGANQILVPGKNYAELPGFAGKTPRKIIEALSPGSKILDVGCGYGQLGAEILGIVKTKQPDDEDFDFEKPKTPPINSTVKIYGFDAQAQKGQNRLTRVKLGNIDDLSLKSFEGDFDPFDLVISSSVLYHLPDYWGGLLRMIRMLKPKGIVLASTMPRVIYLLSSAGAENAEGYLDEPDYGHLSYYRNRNVFDVNGKLIPPGQLVDVLNKNNPHFRLEYGVASSSQVGTTNNGGQISGQRLSNKGNLDLSNMFYCLSNGDLGYIMAQTPEEKTELNKSGYLSVTSRIKS